MATEPSILIHSPFRSVQSLSCVQLLATPRTAAHQASLSITNSRSLPKCMSIELVMPSNHLILCRPLLQIPYDYTVEVRNRFKGLDLIDRVPDELCTEVRDIVQETGIKTVPMEKKCKKQNGHLGRPYIAVKRREVKSKGEKERYKHLNEEFQRIARRDKPSSAINAKK